jgi:hypothetical protein
MMKRGNTVKLKYDFNTANCVEVQSKGRWTRVTERDFRSSNSPRRIVTWDKEDNPIYTEYNGPIYYHGTNIIATELYGSGIQYIHNIRPEFKPTFSESCRIPSRGRK